MNLPQRVYAAMRVEYPNVKDAQLALKVPSKSVAKLKAGKGIGILEATQLANKNPKWIPLMNEAQALSDKCAKNHGHHLTAAKEKYRKGLVNPAHLSTYVKELCGYIG